MTAEPRIISSDMRYLDKHENLMRTRTELAVAQMLEFLGHEYKYDHKENFGGFDATIDFKTDKGFIEVIDGDADIEKYTKIKESPRTIIMAIGHFKTWTIKNPGKCIGFHDCIFRIICMQLDLFKCLKT